MILAIPIRVLDMPDQAPWDKVYTLSDWFRQVFDQLGVTPFPVLPHCNAEEVCRVCDGLIVSGSAKNIYPEYYHHPRLPEMEHTYTVDEYAGDKPLIDAFVNAKKPIMGICGGLQMLNVYFGGTLNQLVPGHNDIPDGHCIHIEKDSFLYSVYQSETVEVNSYHRQCALEPAPGFRVTARAEGGTIEAIERDNIIAVQWHPEVVLDLPLFQAFLNTFF